MTAPAIRLCLLALMLAAVTFIPASTPTAQAYPEPSIVQREWQLEFEHDLPQPIAVRDTLGVVRWYWYITYKVTNNSGQERLFIPELTIATAEGDIVRAGKGVPALVFARIKDRTDNRLMESPAQIVGKILIGEDNARESIIVWPAFEHDVSAVTVFVGGLSGEATEVQNPITGSTVLLNKTLMLDFEFPGNPQTPQFQTVKPTGREWVMR